MYHDGLLKIFVFGRPAAGLGAGRRDKNNWGGVEGVSEHWK